MSSQNDPFQDFQQALIARSAAPSSMAGQDSLFTSLSETPHSLEHDIVSEVGPITLTPLSIEVQVPPRTQLGIQFASSFDALYETSSSFLASLPSLTRLMLMLGGRPGERVRVVDGSHFVDEEPWHPPTTAEGRCGGPVYRTYATAVAYPILADFASVAPECAAFLALSLTDRRKKYPDLERLLKATQECKRLKDWYDAWAKQWRLWVEGAILDGFDEELMADLNCAQRTCHGDLSCQRSGSVGFLWSISAEPQLHHKEKPKKGAIDIPGFPPLLVKEWASITIFLSFQCWCGLG